MKTTRIIFPVEKIKIIVARQFGYDIEQILSNRSQKREIVIARQALIYSLCRYSNLTVVEIGRMFKKDHATVIYSRKTIETLRESDKIIKKTIARIENKLFDLISQPTEDVEVIDQEIKFTKGSIADIKATLNKLTEIMADAKSKLSVLSDDLELLENKKNMLNNSILGIQTARMELISA